MLRHHCIQAKKDKNRIRCLTPTFSWAQKRSEVLHHHRILGDLETKKYKIRSGDLTPPFLEAQKRAEILCHPCIFGDLQTKKDKIRIGCLSPAPKRGRKMLCNFCILGSPQQKGQNQISKPTLQVTMMPLVSQSMGL